MSDLFELFCIQCLYGCCCAVLCASVIEPEKTHRPVQQLSPLSTVPPSVETHEKRIRDGSKPQ